MSSLGINYGQFINTNLPQNGYRTGLPVQTSQTYTPQIQKPQINPAQSDVFQLGREQQQFQSQQKPELGVIDQTFKRFGIFQNKLVQTAMKNNPQISALCAQYGINGRVEAKNLSDTSKHASMTAKYAVKIGERYV